ncbi:hypothetical protein NC652_036731 [Populus alba x Populus x berolinensis]|uniref:Uncharacterized protein n=1 Tax=Populus alba x Populus x berolinensis TaxID=444605 RepID=A0AAD6LK72_9ROSI|nr:hypothetical protein NC652_036731 [Populus alba x Populus x berolinensis]KAJ6968667.1 hypothetical protein NC653_036598 [Populus alba x Populus x berolinensis]
MSARSVTGVSLHFKRLVDIERVTRNQDQVIK